MTRALSLALVLIFGCASATSMDYAGNRYVFAYASGLRVEAYYPTATELQWKALTGPSAGTSGTEHIHVKTLGPGQYFISWVESNGTTVSNVVDLRTMKVTAFVTFEGQSGREGMSDEGTITRLDAR